MQLSPREMQVLLLFADGYRRHQMAEEIGLHDSTIKMHIARMVAKLDAKTPAHAVAIAYHKGILLIPKK